MTGADKRFREEISSGGEPEDKAKRQGGERLALRK
jgi:hypothetical protein